MSDEEIGAFYGKLIVERVDGASNKSKAVLLVPDFASISVSRTAFVTITFSEELEQKEIQAITPFVLDVTLISQTDVPIERKSFSWTTLSFSGN
jgi:hypothetical protein